MVGLAGEVGKSLVLEAQAGGGLSSSALKHDGLARLSSQIPSVGAAPSIEVAHGRCQQKATEQHIRLQVLYHVGVDLVVTVDGQEDMED